MDYELYIDSNDYNQQNLFYQLRYLFNNADLEQLQQTFDDYNQGLLFYRLRDLFQNANPAREQLTFEAMQHVLGDMNVVDHSQPEGSPWRNRPAYLDDPQYQSEPLSEDRKPKLRKIELGSKKDWNAKREAPPPKDWEKFQADADKAKKRPEVQTIPKLS